VAFQYLKEAYKKYVGRLFSRACYDRTTGNVFKLKEARFTLDIRKKYFLMRVVKHRNGLPREVVGALTRKHSRPLLSFSIHAGTGMTLTH